MRVSLRIGLSSTRLALLACAFSLAATSAILAPTAAARNSGDTYEYFTIQIDDAVFEKIVRLLGLSEEQQTAARVSYAEYHQRARAAHDRAAERVNEAGLGEIRKWEQARLLAMADQVSAYNKSGQEPTLTDADMRPDEHLETYAAVANAWNDVAADGERLAYDFLYSLSSILSAEQAGQIERACALVRRECLLEKPQPVSVGGQVKGADGGAAISFPENMDLLLLLDEAMGDNGEIEAALAAISGTPKGLERVEEFRNRLGALIPLYELRMDARLREMIQLRSVRRTADDMRPFHHDHLDESQRRLAIRTSRPWIRLFEVNRQTSDEIAALVVATELPEAARQWRLRFLRQYAPAIYNPDKVDKEYQRLVDSGALSADRRAVLDAWYRAYTARRDPICHAAFESGIAVRRAYANAQPSSTDGEEHKEHRSELHELREQTYKELIEGCL